jgi:hypothetical protein
MAHNLGESVALEILPLHIGTEPDASDSPQEAAGSRPPDIPPETWQALQDAGHSAAERLRDLLQAKAFERLKPSDQARLIELALNRAYGPPIKREMSLTLSGNVSDAVAASLARLSAVDLPEFATDGRERVKTSRHTRDG